MRDCARTRARECKVIGRNFFFGSNKDDRDDPIPRETYRRPFGETDANMTLRILVLAGETSRVCTKAQMNKQLFH